MSDHDRYSNDYKEWDAISKVDAKTGILNLGNGHITTETEFAEAGRADAEQYILPYVPNQGTVMDYGCGIGRMTRAVAEAKPELSLVGLDVSAGMLKQLKKYCGESANRIRTVKVPGDGRMPGVEDSSVDLGWSWLCLQHMEPYDAYRTLTEAYRVIKPGGSFIATFPRLDSPAYGATYRQVLNNNEGLVARRMRLYTPDHATFMFNDSGFAVTFLDRGENLVARGIKI